MVVEPKENPVVAVVAAGGADIDVPNEKLIVRKSTLTNTQRCAARGEDGWAVL